ncbi:ABC transporter permease subunit [Erwinia oleae]|uniref:ABC transporter permease subunit n=1 Tax=Erwinia oleae TaxID=796334 RepID=UPI000552DF2E|nr:ABC transporter permease subunit [Erwinia oleae]
MNPTPIPAQFNDRRRQWADRLTRRCVMACGLLVLAVMLLLFVWLVWVVVPLFSSTTLYSRGEIALWQARPVVALGMDAQQKWGWRIDNQGQGRFIPLDAQPPAPPITLLPDAQHAVTTADNQSVLLQNARGMVVVEPDFHDRQPGWKFPLGDTPLTLALASDALTDVAHPEPARWLVAQADSKRMVIQQFQPNRPATVWRVDSADTRQLLLTPDGRQLFTLSGNILRVWQIGTSAILLREAHTLSPAPQRISLLSGGSSLLVTDDKGVAQWFDIAGENGPRLHKIRYFDGSKAQPLLFSESQRRVFATLGQNGELSLFASKQAGVIFSRQLTPGILSAVFAPRGDGMLIERQGRWQHLSLSNPWPDISLRSLWQKVWYEHYPSPDYVWQSTSADDNYQGKYSLVPLVTGTLKAAGLAMLFATPLALAAAMYTAWFMAPGLRRWVKPAIEMMGALPGVVIGLVAGIWLAPQLANRLSGVLLLPLLLAGVLLACSWLSVRLPPRWRARFCAEGREVWILLPVLLVTALFCLIAVPWLEQQLFGASVIGGDYPQRNVLVAGVAMGFALVPIVFTLAEDAIFSVPASLGQGSLALGATQWQTLTRVVLPGAAAGIFAALMIGFGRAMGETMIVLMATGNTPVTDGGILEGVRSLAANVAIEMPEAAAGGAHYRVLFLSALVLLVFTLIVNTLAELVRQRLRKRYEVQG